MSADLTRNEPALEEYERNRQQFTIAQLQPFEGQWVAFSLDGKQIVAAAAGLLDLDQKVSAAGEDPEQVWLEFIDLRPIKLGAAEFLG
jgi:hypothetical protein